MRRSIVLSFITLLAFTQSVNAQQKGDTTLQSATIEVIQSYKPEVKPMTKPQFTPDLPPRDTSRPGFKYDVPQQTLYYTYSSLPLRPLALGKDTTKLPFPGYLKLGGGNQSTIYLDAGIGNFKGDNYETAIHLHHLSQDGNISNQKISLSGIEAEGTLHTGTNAWRLSLDGLRNQYHYYGYNHNIYEYPEDTIEQTFAGAGAAFDVKNETANKAGINYHPMVRASYYGDQRDAAERTVAFDIPITKDIDTSLQAGLGINGIFTRLSTSLKDADNNIFQITPHVNFHSGRFYGKAGLYPTFGTNGNTFLLPDLALRFQFPNTRFSVSAGWEGRLRQNTYKQLSGFNPYIFNTYETRQTRIDEVYGMLSGNFGSHITASARAGWWQFSNLPMFLNDSADRKNFYILYDELVNAVSFEASIRYQVANTFSIGATGTFYNYYKKTYDRVWHEPGIRLKADMTLRPVQALTITAYATILDRIYALSEQHEEIKLDGVFDIGGGAEYSFIPRLSAFININNLLNDRYQRWYGYNAYGINIYGGLRLKF